VDICVAHPGIGFGGSEAVAMTLLNAFQHDHQVTLLTADEFDCARLNASYHTAVDERRVKVELTPMPAALRRASQAAPVRETLFARHVRTCARQFDVCISAYNFAPFPAPAVQRVADFYWDEAFCREVDPRWPDRFNLRLAARGLYCRAATALAKTYDDRRIRERDLLIANSHWTAGILASRHGRDSRLIYPPVHSEPFDRAAPRTSDFVMLGRITPDKRVAEGIDVIERLRSRGHEIHLHIIGPIPKSDYGARIKALAQERADWVRLRDGIYGAEKFAELARHGFALHMRNGEAFGIAVAEQVKMGLIPFVRKNGGPQEIVGDPRLCFVDETQAVEVIERVLREPLIHASLRAALAERGALFSTERFVGDMTTLLGELKERPLL
jgi:glycosyltransferase involved in cell wall biosynthesis